MSLQTIIDTAQSIEITRSALVATSVSRSGRLLTAARNWVKPWKFTIEPQPVFAYALYRGSIEQIMTGDRFTDSTIKLGNNPGAAWTVEYMGDCARSSNMLTGITIASFTGTTITLNGNSGSGYIFRAGDVIQPAGHRYPYVVTADVPFGSTQVIVNRGLLPDTAFPGYSGPIIVGTGCSWHVKVSKLPSMKLIPGKFIQFTGNFELVESVL